MSVTAPQIVHESETQRQFIRLQLPAMAEILGKRYHLKDLSSGGAAIRDIDVAMDVKNRIDLNLILPFADFSLDITLTAEIQHKDKKLNIIGIRFVDLNPGQIAILNHVIKAYIAGDIIGGNDILNVAARDNFVSVRKHKPLAEQNPRDKFKLYSIYGLMTLACVTLAFFLISSIMKRTLILSTPHGNISTPSFTVYAPTQGIFELKITPGKTGVNEGDIIGTLSIPAMGETPTTLTDVKSPCTCFITQLRVNNNQSLTAGTAIADMVKQKPDMTVSAFIPTNDVHRLRLGGSVTLTIAGQENEISGKIADIKTSDKTIVMPDKDIPEPASLIVITPEGAITLDQVGRPVNVQFHL